MTWRIKASFAAAGAVSDQAVEIDGLTIGDAMLVARAAAMAELDAGEVTLIRAVGAHIPTRRSTATRGVPHV